jgi:ATP-dependent DNA helicase RecQ
MQALGRAGRDGQPAVAILYYSNADLGANVKHMTDTMRAFCRTGSCRREMLLNYFGQSYFDRPSPTHKCCDNCVLLCECSLCVPLQ